MWLPYIDLTKVHWIFNFSVRVRRQKKKLFSSEDVSEEYNMLSKRLESSTSPKESNDAPMPDNEVPGKLKNGKDIGLTSSQAANVKRDNHYPSGFGEGENGNKAFDWIAWYQCAIEKNCMDAENDETMVDDTTNTPDDGDGYIDFGEAPLVTESFEDRHAEKCMDIEDHDATTNFSIPHTICQYKSNSLNKCKWDHTQSYNCKQRTVKIQDIVNFEYSDELIELCNKTEQGVKLLCTRTFYMEITGDTDRRHSRYSFSFSRLQLESSLIYVKHFDGMPLFDHILKIRLETRLLDFRYSRCHGITETNLYVSKRIIQRTHSEMERTSTDKQHNKQKYYLTWCGKLYKYCCNGNVLAIEKRISDLGLGDVLKTDFASERKELLNIFEVKGSSFQCSRELGKGNMSDFSLYRKSMIPDIRHGLFAKENLKNCLKDGEITTFPCAAYEIFLASSSVLCRHSVTAKNILCQLNIDDIGCCVQKECRLSVGSQYKTEFKQKEMFSLDDCSFQLSVKSKEKRVSGVRQCCMEPVMPIIQSLKVLKDTQIKDLCKQMILDGNNVDISINFNDDSCQLDDIDSLRNETRESLDLDIISEKEDQSQVISHKKLENKTLFIEFYSKIQTNFYMKKKHTNCTTLLI